MGCSWSDNVSETQTQPVPFEKVYVDTNTYISDKFEEMLYINVENELWDLIHKKDYPSMAFCFNKSLYRGRKFYFDRNNAVYYVHLFKHRQIVKKIMNNYGLMYTLTTITFEPEGCREYISIVQHPKKENNISLENKNDTKIE